MSTSSVQHTAQIIQFPVGGRKRLAECKQVRRQPTWKCRQRAPRSATRGTIDAAIEDVQTRGRA